MCASVVQVEVIIPTQTKYLDLIGSIGERLARELEGFSGDQAALAYQLNLVLTEATANAIKHTSPAMPEQTVRIVIYIKDAELNIKVYDHSQGFDLQAVPTPDFEHPKEGGMGLFFIRSIMDTVTYTRGNGCNVLELKKDLRRMLSDTDNNGSRIRHA
jgi:serine/threonine-protein kinase RsbW